MDKKVIKIVISIGALGSFLFSIKYMINLLKSLTINENNFIENTSFLVSNITTMVILVYVLRSIYIKEKKRNFFIFSKLFSFTILIYTTLVLDLIIYGFYKFSFVKSSFIIENSISILFTLFSIITAIYMIRNKDIKHIL